MCATLSVRVTYFVCCEVISDGGGRGSSRVAGAAKRSKLSIAVGSPQQLHLPSHPLEVFGVTSPSHTSQQAGGSAKFCSASQVHQI